MIKLSLKRKIIGLAVVAAVLPVVVMMILMGSFQSSVSKLASKELSDVAMANMAQIAKDVYGLCETANDLIQRKINNGLNVARNILKQHKGIEVEKGTVAWDAVNQVTKQTQKVVLPRLTAGGVWLGQNRNPATPTPIVDDVKRLVGITCTIFQRMNENGDMLRVATNVEDLEKTPGHRHLYSGRNAGRSGQPGGGGRPERPDLQGPRLCGQHLVPDGL